MAILFGSTRPRQISRQFGRGVLRTLPAYHETPTAADEAWYVQDQARRDEEARNRRLEQQAGVYECQSRMDAGLSIM